jgi:hypothetical protein
MLAVLQKVAYNDDRRLDERDFIVDHFAMEAVVALVERARVIPASPQPTSDAEGFYDRWYRACKAREAAEIHLRAATKEEIFAKIDLDNFWSSEETKAEIPGPREGV